jgi:hypothetical protein
MANAANCNHEWRILKSENSLVQWMCTICLRGPMWVVFECIHCTLHMCPLCARDGGSCK